MTEIQEWMDFKRRNPNGTVFEYIDEGATECDERGVPIVKEIDEIVKNTEDEEC